MGGLNLGLGGGEDHQDCEFFGNIVKTMPHFRRDKNQAARGNFAVFGSGLAAGASADDVVYLVFAMRVLPVCCPRGQDVEAGPHRRHPQKFEVRLAALEALLGDLRQAGEYRFHAKMPPKISSVNWGIRFWACRSPSGLYH